MNNSRPHISGANGKTPVSVVVVDDSLTIRRLIRMVLEATQDIRVVAEAANAQEARLAIRETAPDVVTLDVEMPGMSGLEFLDKLMALRPLPVVMISSLTLPNSDQSVRALAAGAVEIFSKPGPADQDRWHDLPRIVRQAAQCRPRAGKALSEMDSMPTRSVVHSVPMRSASLESDRQVVVALGASTGGVDALETVLEGFPERCPPTVIVQHMPEAFLNSFATRLNGRFPFEVVLAEHGRKLTWGTVHVAPGGRHHMQLDAKGDCLLLCEGEKEAGHRPSVDVLFRSIAKAGIPCAAALLTGMGRDGASGLVELRKSGARTFGQSEESCVVYGMPRAAVELGAVDKSVPLGGMASTLLGAVEDICSNRNRRQPPSKIAPGPK